MNHINYFTITKYCLSKAKKFLFFGIFFFSMSVNSICHCNENILFTPDFFKRLYRDFIELPSTPAHFTKGEWIIAGSAVSLTAMSFLVDGEVHKNFAWNDNNPKLNKANQIVTRFGREYQIPIILGTWASGLIWNSPKLNKIAADSAESCFLAAGIIQPTLTYISGRDLPRTGEEPMKFRPFTLHRYSFPSGHTAAAFALASAIDTNLRDVSGYWQTPLLYGMAVAVAQSRVYLESHYLSDVVLGAAIGWSVGSWVSKRPRETDKSRLTLLPSTKGFMLTYSFR